MTRCYSFIACILFLARGPGVFAQLENGLIYGETGRTDRFDPFTTHEASAKRLADLMFNSLVNLDAKGEYVGELAKSWSIEPTSVQFKLEDKVFWHRSGKRLSADDIVKTVSLITNEQSEIPNRDIYGAILNAERVGEFEVKITLRQAATDPLRFMMFKILPASAFQGQEALKRSHSFATAPEGTGPYQFVKANEQGEVLFRANEKYFRGKPNLEHIMLRSFSDQSVMAQSLMFNALDLITYVSPNDLPEILGDKRLAALSYDALSFTFFAFNTSRPLLNDKRFRQALTYAVNRQEMLEAFYQGRGILISGPFAPTSWAYNLDIKPVEANLEKAKELLTALGLKDKNQDQILEDAQGKPLTLKLCVPLAGEGDMIKRLSLALQNYLRLAGINVDLQFMDWLVWKEKVLAKHDYDLTVASWSFDDANNITSLFHSKSAKPWGNNFVVFKNPDVDNLLNEADATNDFDKRRAIYQKLHAILADEAPYLYLWTLKHHAAFQNKFSGVRVDPFAFFKHVTQWQFRKG